VDASTLVTLSGSGFSAATQVRLEAEGRAVSLVGAEVRDSQTLLVNVPPGIPRGEYDLVVSDPEQGEIRLPKGFTALGHLRVISIDVGQGDATLIVGPTGRSALIDVGDDNERNAAGLSTIEAVRNRLDQEGIFAPTFFFASHFHRDHVGSLVDLLRGEDNAAGTLDDRIPTEGIFDRGEPLATGGGTEQFYRQVTQGLRNSTALGQVFDLGGGVTLRAVSVDGFVDGLGTPINIERDDENQRSLTLHLSAPRRQGAATFTGLFLGDLSGGGLGTVNVESAVAQEVGHVDVLRTAHHGSETSTAQGTLTALSPLVVLISAGVDNPFCHPDNKILNRISSFAPQARTFLTTGGIVTDNLVTDCCVCPATQKTLDTTPASEVVVNGDIEVDVSLFQNAFTSDGVIFGQ
jgi:competence protein ComEC